MNVFIAQVDAHIETLNGGEFDRKAARATMAALMTTAQAEYNIKMKVQKGGKKKKKQKKKKGGAAGKKKGAKKKGGAKKGAKKKKKKAG